MKLADIVERVSVDPRKLTDSEDEFGRRYTVDLIVQTTEVRRGVVRTGWFVPHRADEARLVTLYVRR